MMEKMDQSKTRDKIIKKDGISNIKGILGFGFPQQRLWSQAMLNQWIES